MAEVNKFAMTKAEVAAHVKMLTQYYKASMAFSRITNSLASGTHVEVKGSDLIGDKATAKAIQRSFIAQLKDIKQIVQAARKSTRSKIYPEQFKGVYSAVYIGAALQYFVDGAAEDAFGYVMLDDGTEVSVKSQLTQMRRGYTIRNTITYALHRYIQHNGLSRSNFVLLDDHLRASFDGDIAPDFVQIKTGEKEQVGKKIDKQTGVASTRMKNVTTKVPHADLPEIRNVFQAIENGSGEPVVVRKDGLDAFKMFNFQSITAVDHYPLSLVKSFGESDDVWGERARDLESAEVREAMLAEHYLLQSINNEDARKRADLRKQQKARK